MIGREVLGAAGRPVGRLADLAVLLDGQAVRRVLVNRGALWSLVPWEAVGTVHAGQVTLRTDDAGAFRIGALAGALDPDEILLGRDVLDTQVIDVVGQRMARVADVLLTRTRDCHLEVVGVDVGFTAVLRRLGLGRLAGGRRTDLVAWPDLHLTSRRGHTVQVCTPRATVHRLDPRALAALVSRVDTDSASEILALREPAVAAEALRVASPEVRDRIVAAMAGERAPRPSARSFLRSRVLSRSHLNWHANGKR